MSRHRLAPFAFVFATSLFGTAATAHEAAAQQRQLFTWTGRVDRETLLTMQDRRVSSRSGDRTDEDAGRFSVSTALPRTSGWVRVDVRDGRGDVAVIEQPSARNGYATVIRLRDPSGGAGSYRITAYWENGGDRSGGGIADIIRGRDDRDSRGSGGAVGRAGGTASGRGGYGNDGGYGRNDDRGGYGRNDDRGGYGRNDDRGGYGRGNIGSGRDMFRWSGSVDGVLEIRLRGDQVEYRNVSGRAARDLRVSLPDRNVPRGNTAPRIDRWSGRGSVRIVQQPAPRNGFTTIIQVRDPQSGYGQYALDLIWRGSGNSRW